MKVVPIGAWEKTGSPGDGTRSAWGTYQRGGLRSRTRQSNFPQFLPRSGGALQQVSTFERPDQRHPERKGPEAPTDAYRGSRLLWEV